LLIEYNTCLLNVRSSSTPGKLQPAHLRAIYDRFSTLRKTRY